MRRLDSWATISTKYPIARLRVVELRTAVRPTSARLKAVASSLSALSCHADRIIIKVPALKACSRVVMAIVLRVFSLLVFHVDFLDKYVTYKN